MLTAAFQPVSTMNTLLFWFGTGAGTGTNNYNMNHARQKVNIFFLRFSIFGCFSKFRIAFLLDIPLAYPNTDFRFASVGYFYLPAHNVARFYLFVYLYTCSFSRVIFVIFPIFSRAPLGIVRTQVSPARRCMAGPPARFHPDRNPPSRQSPQRFRLRLAHEKRNGTPLRRTVSMLCRYLIAALRRAAHCPPARPYGQAVPHQSSDTGALCRVSRVKTPMGITTCCSTGRSSISPTSISIAFLPRS